AYLHHGFAFTTLLTLPRMRDYEERPKTSLIPVNSELTAAGQSNRRTRAVRQLKNEEGMALVLALSILVVLGMLGVVVTSYTTSAQRSASRSSFSVSAYTLAEAGINNAVSVLSKPSNNAID